MTFPHGLLTIPDMNPWDIVPAFTQERLVALASRLLRIRADAAKLQDPDQGDSHWVLGCRVYERTRFQLSCAAKAGELTWLTAHMTTNLRFYVKIGGVPIHIFRGDPDDPSGRQLERGRDKQSEMFGDGYQGGWANYLVVDTDDEGNGLRVVFFQANERAEKQHEWVVPVGVPVTAAVRAVASITREGRDLAAPTVAARIPTAGRGNDDGERDV